ncbi:hypothetical protein WJX72_010264 [[Myrmecia] bisecta]|uniref:Uncharacterized protein n=1 Tax=[Myrmecia] bisecta TaxID=41462 RepID=A0AAW1PNH7_9CHLO
MPQGPEMPTGTVLDGLIRTALKCFPQLPKGVVPLNQRSKGIDVKKALSLPDDFNLQTKHVQWLTQWVMPLMDGVNVSALCLVGLSPHLYILKTHKNQRLLDAREMHDAQAATEGATPEQQQEHAQAHLALMNHVFKKLQTCQPFAVLRYMAHTKRWEAC